MTITKITNPDDLANHTGLVIFSAPWCNPCKSYKPVLERYARDHGIALAEVDASEQRDLAARYGVRAVPATFYVQAGEVYKSKLGTLQGAQLAELCPNATS